MYGGRLGPLGLAAAQPRSRGAQVFTYRELERATDGFGEGNVLGRGAYGVVYRGRLGDGTPAAIKRLQLDLRRQGEREFRVEVTNKLNFESFISRAAHARPHRSAHRPRPRRAHGRDLYVTTDYVLRASTAAIVSRTNL
jgi:hypothetical protein